MSGSFLTNLDSSNLIRAEIIESIGDTNLFMNNATYPNDINIRKS